jgi:hypothetical protein
LGEVALSRATKASEPPPLLACAPPAVLGKLVEVVRPATYTSPLPAMASAKA